MKKLFNSGIGIILAIAVLYIIFLRECKYKPTEGFSLVADSFIDSLEKVTNMPPDTFVVTKIVKGETVTITHTEFVYITDSTQSGIKIYTDSIVNDSINVWSSIYIDGFLRSWEWKYKPITTIIERNINIYVPKIVEKPVPVPAKGLYLSGIAGGNMDSFVFGAGIDLITKKNNLYGLQYQRFGEENIYSIRIGAKIFR